MKCFAFFALPDAPAPAPAAAAPAAAAPAATEAAKPAEPAKFSA